MQNTIIDKFSDLLLAVKEDSALKDKLIQICKLPTQQRIVEIEKYRLENPQLPITNLLNLFKNDMIVNEVVNYLTGKHIQSAEAEQANQANFLKKNFILIGFGVLLIIIIILLIILVFKDNKTQSEDPTAKLQTIVLPDNYEKQSVLLYYRKIMSQDNPQLKIGLIEEFLQKFPASDYTEEVKTLYLKTLFSMNDKDKILVFLRNNMDYSSKYFFEKLDILIENKYLDIAKQLVAEQLAKAPDLKVQAKLKATEAHIYYYENKYEQAIQSYFESLRNPELEPVEIPRIYFNLSNIYRVKSDSKKVAQSVESLIYQSEDPKFRVLGLMMQTELLYLNGKSEDVKKNCKKILEMKDQKLMYVINNNRIDTSHGFAQFLLSRVN